MSALKPGSLLHNGSYKIVKNLGQGGFGITYLANQELLERQVCIKEFFVKEYCDRDESTSAVTLGTKSNAVMMDQYKNKFIKEARTILKLEHPNIVRIFDVWEENCTAYIAMEYIPGHSLAEYVRDVGHISVDKAVAYIRSVGSALAFAHGKKVMHLDVKPSNIMRDEKTDRVVLIDFGLAKQYTEGGEQTSSTPIGISHGYAPMEQYQAGGVKDFSPSTDVYSLGATLFKLITGINPPNANTVFESGLPVMSLSIPENVKAAITAAMQPRRNDRPQSVKAFLQILDRPSAGPVAPPAYVGPVESEETVIPEVEVEALKPAPSPAPEEKSNGLVTGIVVIFAIISIAIIALAIAL